MKMFLAAFGLSSGALWVRYLEILASVAVVAMISLALALAIHFQNEFMFWVGIAGGGCLLAWWVFFGALDLYWSVRGVADKLIEARGRAHAREN